MEKREEETFQSHSGASSHLSPKLIANREILPEAEYRCPKCHSVLQQKTGKFGIYWRCENRQCEADFTDKDGEPVIAICPDCHNGYLRKRTIRRQEYWTCSKYPSCNVQYPADASFLLMPPTKKL